MGEVSVAKRGTAAAAVATNPLRDRALLEDAAHRRAASLGVGRAMTPMAFCLEVRARALAARRTAAITPGAARGAWDDGLCGRPGSPTLPEHRCECARCAVIVGAGHDLRS